MIRLLVHDESVLMREALRHLLDSYAGLKIVDSPEDTSHALEQCRTGRVDIVVVAVRAQESGVLEFIHQVRVSAPHVAIVALDLQPTRHYAVRLIGAGSRGYVTSHQTPEDLVAAIRRVVAGGRYVSTTLAEHLVFEGSPEERESHEQLSNREYCVLIELAGGRSVKEIASRLTLSPKTVSTYRSRLLDKMGLSSNVELVRYALRHGLLPGGKSHEDP